MIRQLGRRMGLKFDHEAIDYIYQLYGGHPMLTRLACSKLNMYFGEQDRPIDIDRMHAERLMKDINAEVSYYFGHVISELQEFYPDEYEMFEMLACGQIADFLELSKDFDLTKHLYDYGLVEDRNGIPAIKLPVAGTYVASELAKREQRTAMYKLRPKKERKDWVSRRIRSIIQDMRQLEEVIKQASTPKLFGDYSFPEADKLLDIPEVDSDVTFVAFINTMNRCFVESIENYGREINCKNYFWKEIASNYKSLFSVLYRIKVYRHSQDHLHLNPQFQQDYQAFLTEDTAGFSDSGDQKFVIQQRLLDNLLVSIQVELDKLM